MLLCGLLVGSITACGGTTPRPGGGTSSSSGGKNELRGKLVIALEWAGQDQQLVQAVIDAYEMVNPKVDIEYKAVAGDGDYKSYLETSLSSDDLSSCPFDIVFNNRIPSFLNTKKFVDYSQYLYEENPYNDNQIWADTLDPSAYTATGSKGEIFRLSFQNTQVAFAYNKDIIDEAGVDPKEFETWDGFIGACEKISKIGYTPLAIAGDMDSFSGRQMAWMMNVYVDQYFRSVAQDVHAQPQDFNYDARVDSVWEYTPYPTLTDNMTQDEIAAAWEYDQDLVADIAGQVDARGIGADQELIEHLEDVGLIHSEDEGRGYGE
jgi:ABC-type glycerol-3-phosphate transport system substrate-binding protein